MISPSLFKKHKCDTDSLKAIFNKEKKGKDVRSEKVKKLVQLICDRIKDGRTRALKDYRIWSAVDLAFDAPFNQETPTLIRHITSTCKTAKDVEEALSKWGLDQSTLFCKNKREDGSEVLELNIPAFFEILVPAVKAYVSVRLSSIFNDRNLDPLFDYRPRHYTEKNRVMWGIVTDLVDVMASNYGYADNLKQVIFNTLMYSVALEFPCEPWHSEKQEDAEGKEYTVKEGVRYVTPHITRTFYDLQYPLSTFNTDTGNTYAGYWSVVRFGDLSANTMYWNKDNISYGYNWLDKNAPYANYFEQAYPCTLSLPVAPAANKETDREEVRSVYTQTDYDKGVFVTYIFMKITPADWDLGTYTHPLWFRFMVAADDAILYAEPYPYCPVTYSGYDPDQNRQKNTSLALEIIPWQDLLGNTLTQIVLTIKRNLANIIFYDTNMDVGGAVKQMQSRSQWQYNNINILGYDSTKLTRAGLDPKQSFHEVKFAYADTSQMVQSITLYISVMERMLGISSQEIGSAASHQQSVQEIKVITASTTNRSAYSASGIDAQIDAKKRQVFTAMMAYRDPDFESEIPDDIDDAEKHIKDAGMQMTSRTKSGYVVKGKKENLKSLRVDQISTQRDGPERFNDSNVGQAIYQALQSINQNPALVQIIDPESLAKLYETAAKYMGADRDFRLKLNKDGVMANQLQQIIQDIEARIVQTVEQKVAADIAKPAAEAVQEIEQKNQQQDQQILQLSQQAEQLNQAVASINQIIEAASQQQPVPPMMQPMPPNASYATEPIPAGP